MANTTLNSRIVLCSKDSTTWASNSTVALRGEVMLEWTSTDYTVPPKIKVGDGVHTFAQLPYATLTETEIRNIITQAAYNLQVATDSILGGILSGGDITVNSSGVVSVNDNSHNHTIANVTNLQTTLDGKVDKVTGKQLSTEDFTTGLKNKLEGIATGAEVNQNAFSNITVGSTTIAADAKTDTLTIVAGDNITLTPDATNDQLTIAATDTTYSNATTSAAGLMSATDKTKLNATNIAYGTCSTGASTAAKEITINGNTNWALTAGAMIAIKFSNTNSANNPTFNVNSTGAKSVWYNTGLITTSNLNKAGYASRIANYIYDGTQYVFVGWSYDQDTTYANYSFGHGYGTQSNSSASATVTVTLSNYALSAGGVVAVKFNYAVPANATMNINSKGAKNIYFKGAAITVGVINAGDVATFIYDGTQYHVLSVDRWSTAVSNITRSGTTFTATREDGTTFTFTQQDNNTTYTFASGDGNGQIKVTPSGGTAQNVDVTGLKSAAYTESSAFATSAQGTKADGALQRSGGTMTGALTLSGNPTADNHAANKAYVDSSIDTKIAAADALRYKGTVGTGGTVTTLPTSGVNIGDCYKVAVDGTYAGQSAKVGDLFIALTEPTPAANSTGWSYIPSGNERETLLKYVTSASNVTLSTTASTGTIALGNAATKIVDTSISAGSTSTNLPTSASVASFVEGKGYVTANDKVKQTSSTTNSAYPLLASASASPTSGSADYSIYNTGVTVNMSTKTLSASEFNGSLNANHLYQTSGEWLILDGNFS